LHNRFTFDNAVKHDVADTYLCKHDETDLFLGLRLITRLDEIVHNKKRSCRLNYNTDPIAYIKVRELSYPSGVIVKGPYCIVEVQGTKRTSEVGRSISHRVDMPHTKYLLHIHTSSFFFWYSAVHNSRSMTPITWQAAIDDEEQRPLLQDILEAAVDDRRQAAVDVEEQRAQLQDIFEAAIDGNHV